jgi:hypothetical protein
LEMFEKLLNFVIIRWQSNVNATLLWWGMRGLVLHLRAPGHAQCTHIRHTYIPTYTTIMALCSYSNTHVCLWSSTAASYLGLTLINITYPLGPRVICLPKFFRLGLES